MFMLRLWVLSDLVGTPVNYLFHCVSPNSYLCYSVVRMIFGGGVFVCCKNRGGCVSSSMCGGRSMCICYEG